MILLPQSSSILAIMGAAPTSAMSLSYYQTAQRHVSEYDHRCENLKPLLYFFFSPNSTVRVSLFSSLFLPFILFRFLSLNISYTLRYDTAEGLKVPSAQVHSLNVLSYYDLAANRAVLLCVQHRTRRW